MAGSGKTLFCQRLSGLNKHIFSVNLDPAVLNAKMPLNEDIRDAVDYYKTMKEYNLGPNGAITTCLNLYMLRVSEVVKKIAAKYVIIDTPGQIEAFTWSSSGHVLLDTLKTLDGYETKILYTIDSLASQESGVFMSNMIYAASLMARFQVETVAVFNKNDISGCEKIVEWIRDYQVFQESLSEDIMANCTYRSMALHFEEFYRSIKTVSVSALSGAGKSEFFRAVVNGGEE
ncbi:UNVERIFIED_CONTAM: hypothetical protein PYX00_011751 [Menopon gallinae]|uniref:GPN-loop GTPase n=1 Tax=Menopon gallinae TaxID=328185 RepID=A0AAW2H877_9NEOP